MEPRLTRAQRRKSLPAQVLARSLPADAAGPTDDVQREPSREDKAATAREVSLQLSSRGVVNKNLRMVEMEYNENGTHDSNKVE